MTARARTNLTPAFSSVKNQSSTQGCTADFLLDVARNPMHRRQLMRVPFTPRWPTHCRIGPVPHFGMAQSTIE